MVFKSFLCNCLVHGKKNRFLFEYSRLDYRKRLLDRFSHNCERLIISNRILNKIEIKKFTKEDFICYLNDRDKVFVFSSSNLEIREYDLDAAFTIMFNDFSPVIVLTEKKCLIKPETCSDNCVLLISIE